MKLSGGQIVMRALVERGITHSFGIPGTHNIELYDVMGATPGFVPVLVTDEQSASFMADGFARSSGRLAVVNVVPGAGLTHALSGIAEAFMDQVPMLVLACGIRTDTGKAFQLHDIDQVGIVTPVCKRVFTPQTGQNLSDDLHKAIDLAYAPPAGPSCVIVPANLYLFPHSLTLPPLPPFGHPPPQGGREIPEGIITTLNHARHIAFYVGAGCVDQGEGLVNLADKLDAVVFTTIAGKGIFPEEHARFVWNGMGAAVPKVLREIEREIDCVLAIGCRFAEVATASYGWQPPPNLIHIDVDTNVFSKNFPAKITWQETAKQAIAELLEASTLKSRDVSGQRLERLRAAHQALRQEQRRHFHSSERVSPERLLTQMQERVGQDAIFVVDSGNGLFLAVELLRLKSQRAFLGPFDYSCMGYAVPAAIGAKFSCPQRDVVALIGDGAFLLTGLEILTAVAANLGIVFCVLRDGELSQIAQFQKISLARKTLTEISPLNLEYFAKAVGVEYRLTENEAGLSQTIDQALAIARTGRPVLVEVNIDYTAATQFSQAVVKTNFLRFPWKDRFRLIGRVIRRRLF